MLELWGGFEPTVNRVGNRYFDQLDASGHARRISDLALVADLGCKAVRYPVLWERTHDWTWSDERLPRIADLDLRPIVGLIHHGSGPRHTNLLADDFAGQLAEFAAAVAARYPWVRDWTPVNEPLTTARFSALYGHWYPHARDDHSFARALLNQCRAIVLSMRAIREVIPDARLVQTEDLGKTWSTPHLAYQAELENERRWLTFDLLCGALEDDMPMGRWLRRVGIAPAELEWFRANACPPDVLGINHYLSSERFLDERVDRYPADAHGGNGRDVYADVLAARVLGAGPAGPGTLLLETWARYRRAVAVTEAHNGCTREEQLRWLRDVWDGARGAQRQGADVRAVTIWSLLGAFGWADLLTAGLDSYEPGVFDLRAPLPRPTALASMARSIAAGKEHEHPVLATEGWWRRPERLWYPPEGEVARPRYRRSQPLLITGAAGTLGRAFARLCDERGLAHVVTSRAELELTDSSSVDRALRAIRPWAVVNAAGYVRVDDAEKDQPACYRENTLAVEMLARATGRAGLPLVTFSSDLVFDGSKAVPYVESDEVRPLNIYGESKAEAERLALAANDASLVVRTSAFFGPWDEHNFVTQALQALESGRSFTAPSDTVVSPTYVPDLVHATLDLLIDEECGSWHLANDGAVTWFELACLAAEAAEAGNRETIVAARSAEVGWMAERPRNSSLASERGWIMPSLEDAIARYVEARKTEPPRTSRRLRYAVQRTVIGPS